jgi:hypothetical protein
MPLHGFALLRIELQKPFIYLHNCKHSVYSLCTTLRSIAVQL